ncbi:MAG TPA: BON domain-containing protein [Chloroflexota bacterium]|nr:BON domain-containing protein [Chloroflexota bacterium]
MHVVRDGIIGLVLGVSGGIVAGLLLAPRRQRSSQTGTEFGSDQASANVLSRLRGDTGTGLLPDEQITLRVKRELEQRGQVAPRVDVTTVDRVVYLRGKEPDPIRADAIVAIAHDVSGVADVIDEIRREA